MAAMKRERERERTHAHRLNNSTIYDLIRELERDQHRLCHVHVMCVRGRRVSVEGRGVHALVLWLVGRRGEARADEESDVQTTIRAY